MDPFTLQILGVRTARTLSTSARNTPESHASDRAWTLGEIPAILLASPAATPSTEREAAQASAPATLPGAGDRGARSDAPAVATGRPSAFARRADRARPASPARTRTGAATRRVAGLAGAAAAARVASPSDSAPRDHSVRAASGCAANGETCTA